MPNYDAIIIGTGQSGPALARRLVAAGWKVAIIERKLFGGTCVNTGCTPTKTLVAGGCRCLTLGARGPRETLRHCFSAPGQSVPDPRTGGTESAVVMAGNAQTLFFQTSSSPYRILGPGWASA
jgi:Pyridine nucleotide-disulphide oxidoreductase